MKDEEADREEFPEELENDDDLDFSSNKLIVSF